MYGAGLRLSDGELFFGGQNGFNHFNPSNLKTNQNIPQVVLTDLKVDNQLVSPSKEAPIEQSMLLADAIRLRYKQGFSIGFEALNFTVPEANQYEYQLKGFDKNWIRAGKEHSAYYGNIPPGEYTFRVRASNNDGIWNQEGRSIKVVVAPPYWRTNTAYAAYVLILAALLFYLRQLSIKRLQMRFSLQQERNHAKLVIERQRKEAEYLHQLDQMKIKFLTNLSHEFRTPISLILGPVDNLIAMVKDEAPMNYLNLIKRNTKRLLNLVNQLLDFRKMEEQELKLQCTEGDLVFFTKDICDSFNDVARRKEIDFGFYTELTTLKVLFDHDKMERILFNILSNAFKFTPEKGDISVRLKELETAQEEGFKSVSISISDSGIGVPENVQSRIFESFFQHDTNSQVLIQGTGIGLSITKEFVKMHGGKIWVESNVGEGSVFTFTLKLKQEIQIIPEVLPGNMNEEEGHQPAKNKHGSEPSLLIVEDDDDFRMYIKENLKQAYRIYEAPNGKEGWQRTLFHHPDIILCDVQMPVMNGLELVQKLKADKRTKHIPVILLTAADTINGTIDGLESGAIDYITKPFDFTVLKAKIHNILLLNQSFKDTYSKQVTVGLPETESVSDKDKFLKTTLTYIYENLDNPQLSVEVLSTHLCMSRASLYNRLLEYTGMSPVEFIRNVKLEKAKSLLEKSDMTVTEVAYETGFANPNYFAKVFKAKYNMTPSEFHEEKKK
jgi:signal transduction histidine kinase/DNA-binding response OmpR family regulator